MHTRTHNSCFFAQGVDDENFKRLQNSFDGKLSDDLITLLPHRVPMSAFRECPIQGKEAKE